MKKGFTLIELIMVVAILAIIATLAVNRIGNLRERAARTVSMTNQIAISRAVDAFLTTNPNGSINYLDSLINYKGDDLGDGSGFTLGETTFSQFYTGPSDKTLRTDTNEGLTPRLITFKGAPLLCSYSLNSDEVQRLTNRGFKYVMQHVVQESDISSPFVGDDGDQRTYTDDEKNALVLDPQKSACFARAITNSLYVAAISPFSKIGRDVYRACGQKLLDTTTYAANGRYSASENDVIKDLKAKGGVLLAFGLGKDATIIGSKDCGIESVPVATYPLKKYYRQFILLFHVDTSTPAGRVDFRGVLDPCGFTVDQARANID